MQREKNKNGWVRGHALVWILALSACGGGGGSGPAPAPTPLGSPPASPPAGTAPTVDYGGPVVYTVGQPITALVPTVTGTPSSFTVSPALPGGLTLDVSSGRVLGTPTVASAAAHYTITASNSAGSATAVLTITVNSAAPPPLPAPSGLVYASPQNYQVGTAIAPLVPLVTGTVTSYVVNPELPAGLSLNATTGHITGTPAAITAQGSYAITASNASGATTFVLVLTIAGSTPSGPAPSPTLTLAPEISQIASGGSVTLTWASTNAQSCTASGGWTGSKPLSGSESIGPLTATTVFFLSCSGAGGSVNRQAATNVLPLPDVELTPDRTSVIPGAKVNIQYRVSHAAHCNPLGNWPVTFNGGGVSSTVIGNFQVGPIAVESDFGLICSNVVGIVQRTVHISLASGENQPPVAVDDTHSVAEDTVRVVIPYTTLAANDSDPEGRLGPLRYIEWSLDDGGEWLTGLFSSTDSIVFDVRPNAVGPILFRYLIEDDIGQKSNVAILTVTIIPADDQPIAVSDTAGAIRDIPLEIDVVANDEDLDPPVTIEVSVPPMRGSASVVDFFGRQVVRYVPNTGYEGPDTFQYLLTDANGDTATAPVTLTVGRPLRISPAARFARLGVASPADWTCRDSIDTAREWSRILYQHFKDSFDFFLLLNNGDTTCKSRIAGEHVPAKNDVAGIGQGVFDQTSLFGSAGRLRGVVWLSGLNSLLIGPTLHELAHNWANFIEAVEPSDIGPHWGFSSGGGQLGGFALHTLQDLGGGQYRASDGLPNSTGFGLNVNGGPASPYSELELYLMGLREPVGVPDLVIARGASFVAGQPGLFTAASLDRLTIDDLIAKHGARSPTFAASPKDFRVLVVVMTKRELTSAEFDKVDADVENFGRAGDDGEPLRQNFWEATRGVARLLMEGIDLELK